MLMNLHDLLHTAKLFLIYFCMLLVEGCVRSICGFAVLDLYSTLHERVFLFFIIYLITELVTN